MVQFAELPRQPAGYCFNVELLLAFPTTSFFRATGGRPELESRLLCQAFTGSLVTLYRARLVIPPILNCAAACVLIRLTPPGNE